MPSTRRMPPSPCFGFFWPPTAGYAMGATDRRRVFGAVIGKALRPLRAGTGLIPALVALQ